MLRLTAVEQTLLRAALTGKTDSEPSADLRLSVVTAKKRWRSIFARVEQFPPEILSDTGAIGDGRGPKNAIAFLRTFGLMRKNCGRFYGIRRRAGETGWE